MVLVEPSPKSHSQEVILPVDWSVKLTVKGADPLVGLAEKSTHSKHSPKMQLKLSL